VLEVVDESELDDDVPELGALDVLVVLLALEALDEPDAAGALPLLRKSVTYQPVPFS
jgi:hypothetical protein